MNMKKTTDWHKDKLTLETKLAGFRMTQNLRRFLQSHFGEPVIISWEFRHWLKQNPQKDLAAALSQLMGAEQNRALIKNTGKSWTAVPASFGGKDRFQPAEKDRIAGADSLG